MPTHSLIPLFSVQNGEIPNGFFDKIYLVLKKIYLKKIYSGRKCPMGSLSKNILIQPLTKQVFEFLATKY